MAQILTSYPLTSEDVHSFKIKHQGKQNPCEEHEDRKCMLLGFQCVRCDPLMSRGGFDGSEWGTNELALSMAGLYSVLLMA